MQLEPNADVRVVARLVPQSGHQTTYPFPGFDVAGARDRDHQVGTAHDLIQGEEEREAHRVLHIQEQVSERDGCGCHIVWV